MKNTNKLNKEDRIERVKQLLSLGLMKFEVVDICKKEWQVSTRTVERYLTEVYKFLTKSLKEQDVDMILLEYNSLISKYEKMGDKKMAYSYRLQRDKILGLTTKMDITSGGEALKSNIIYIERP